MAVQLSRRDMLLTSLALAGVPRSIVSAPRGPALSSAIFRDVAAEVGLDFHHFNGATGEHFMPEIMGAGVALFDYDNDGDLDVYLVQGSQLEPGKKPLFSPPAGWKPGNRLFRNLLVESGKCEDVSGASGIASSYGPGLGVIGADFNGDGLVDIYVANDTAANRLWLNQGDGTFKESGLETGVAYSADGLAKAGMGVALGD